MRFKGVPVWHASISVHRISRRKQQSIVPPSQWTDEEDALAEEVLAKLFEGVGRGVALNEYGPMTQQRGVLVSEADAAAVGPTKDLRARSA